MAPLYGVSSYLKVADAERIVDVLLAALPPVVGSGLAQRVRVAVAILERQRVAFQRLLRQDLEVDAADSRRCALSVS